jgi:putative transposase
MHYRRANAKGGTYFFTVNLADRTQDLLVKHISVLRESTRLIRQQHTFEIVTMVVLPDHLHAIWRLPSDDANYAMRWSQIKAAFSRALPKQEPISPSRQKKRERGIWQRRYWEHQIQDEQDLAKHMDYIHYNPVKHGYVNRAVDWPYSSIHRYMRQGWFGADWGVAGNEPQGRFGD